MNNLHIITVEQLNKIIDNVNATETTPHAHCRQRSARMYKAVINAVETLIKAGNAVKHNGLIDGYGVLYTRLCNAGTRKWTCYINCVAYNSAAAYKETACYMIDQHNHRIAKNAILCLIDGVDDIHYLKCDSYKCDNI